jgi:hypothetical protein
VKGLDLSRSFFEEWLLPFIDQQQPGLRFHIAAGRFMGSDAIGADDHLSADHGWGPTVEVYLDDEYEIDDGSLTALVEGSAPGDFRGARRRGGHDSAITLRRTNAYIESLFGCVPESPRDWLCCNSRPEDIESALYFLRHGSLFHDGSGRLTALRTRYRYYPDDIHRLRLAACCYDIAHYGEYNFVWRLVDRDDVIAMQIALAHFSKAVLRLHFYLDRDFAPYWKWLPHEFMKRGYAPSIHAQLLALPRLAPSEQSAAIQTICERLRDRLCLEKVVSSNVPNAHGTPWFFLFREQILEAITDPSIRALTF